MEEVYRKVKAYIEKHRMISGGDVIVAGVSGGADSVCMLSVLRKLTEEIPFRLFVVHVHHGVREDAQEDADYVKRLCEEWNIPFTLKKVDMNKYAKENRLSPEEAGRQLRYQAFEEALCKETGAKIAVAHNRNDRAETMLFHLFRGSGLKGLGSIRPVRERVIRPLLCLERKEIEAYLSEKKMSYCMDSTNYEDTYTRNKIRHQILAYADAHICQNAVAHVGDAAEILAQADDFITKQTILACDRCVIAQEESETAINLAAFREEDIFIQKMILLRCVEQITPYRKDITREHINDLMELTGKCGSRELILPYNLRACKEYDKLILYKLTRRESDAGEETPWEERNLPPEYLPVFVTVPGEVSIPGLGKISFQYVPEEAFFYKKGQNIPEKTYTKWFDYDKITKVLMFRTRKTGDYLTIDNALRKKTVKEYMINEKIPKMQRERIYLLADGQHIVWIPGYRISQYYKVNENTKRILQVQLKEESDV
ncbi:MAG: tRNA lysidine(34) synthetase TilS [Lachnospiraceae bacterium]|nr:tRNA lysidine(34) synthetase TilS [Lachnospiraceae bacterium]